jgi:threonine/homoserine/homoserine lactone efflux protein
MLGQAIGGILASAVGVALSPVPIIAVILVLGTPKARSNGPAFALGWVGGLVVVSVVVLLLASGASNPNSGSATAVNAIKLALGAVFLFMAAGQWQKRPRQGEEATLPKWMQTVDAFTPAKSVGLGALLSAVNPKNLALTIAAAGSIAQVGLNAGQSAVAVAVFVVLGSLTVAGPVVFYMVATKAAEGPLSDVKQFMSDHNAVIMCVVLLVLGAKLVGDGIAGLST